MALPEPVDQSLVAGLFAHNTWANLSLLEFCATLSDVQLDTTIVGTYGSIRATLLHIAGGEVSYVQRVNGKLPPEPLTDEFPGFAVLKQSMQWSGDELLQLALATRADSLVVEDWPTAVERYPLVHLLIQAINHATEHRTHISSIITQLGLAPPDTSGWQYMVDRGLYQLP